MSGARSNCFVIDTCQQERVVGIQFLPGGAFPFFRTPASDVKDVSIDLEDVWPKRTAEIREQLLGVRCWSLLGRLERCLFEQLVRPLELHPAVTYAVGQFQRCARSGRVAAVTERVGLSAPFSACAPNGAWKNDVDWAQIALECGYYDQAHFIHDFESFSGLTPTAYLAAATPHLNYIPLI